MQIADLDPDWAYLNWQREKAIMLNQGHINPHALLGHNET